MVGEFIVLKRKQLNMSRKEFAEKVGITYNYATQIETGQRNLGKKMFSKVAKVLNVDEKELELSNGYEESDNWYILRKEQILAQIKDIDKQIVRLDTEKTLYEKQKNLLCEQIEVLNQVENGIKEKECGVNE